MAKARSTTRSASKKKPAKLAKAPRFSKRTLSIFGVGFALVGAFLLFRAFGGTAYYNYHGTLTASNPTASYSLTTGRGVMDISYSNNTADVTLTIRNKAGTVIGKLDSRGRKDVKLSTTVVPDTYTFSLTTTKAFNTRKGFSVKINYPEADTVNPVVAITRPLEKGTVRGLERINATATDDEGIKDVKFYVGKTLLKTDTTSTYSTPWDTTTVADGTVTIRVVATDINGNVGEASGTIVIDNTVTPAEEVGSRFPGDPNPRVSKKSYWGSSTDGSGYDPFRHETATGKSLSIRRTFYRWDHVTNMNSRLYNAVASDTSNNRLPFISIKTPGWKAVADGQYDAQLDAMLRKLDSYGKPIWLVAHHEPEGGGSDGNNPDDPGGPSEWRRMQQKIRQRINTVGTKNIAFMPVTMTWTWDTRSNRNPDDWWVDGIWDAYCVDHYNDTTSGDVITKKTWGLFVSWVEAKNIPYCLGEWGTRGTDAQAGQKVRDFWNWSFNNNKDLIGYAYFDSAMNSPSGAWTLEGEQLKAFQDILKNDTRVQRINDLR